MNLNKLNTAISLFFSVIDSTNSPTFILKFSGFCRKITFSPELMEKNPDYVLSFYSFFINVVHKLKKSSKVKNQLIDDLNSQLMQEVLKKKSNLFVPRDIENFRAEHSADSDMLFRVFVKDYLEE